MVREEDDMTVFQKVNKTVTVALCVAAQVCYLTGRHEAVFILACWLVGWMWKANWRDS